MEISMISSAFVTDLRIFGFLRGPGVDNKTGGVIIDYRKSTFSCSTVPTFQILSVGRFVRLHFSFAAQEFLSSGGDFLGNS